MTRPLRESSSYLQWIIASRYYDGVMEGIGERTSDGDIVWFKAVAWDEEQWQRVFVVARVESSLARELVSLLESVEPPRSPFWLPGAATGIPPIQNLWDKILVSALATHEWHVVEAHDPLGPFSERLADTAMKTRLSELVGSDAFVELRGTDILELFLRQLSPR